tara:strand:- start:2343 stop:3683 length:1341 start_codon:yes stop_codon:yes gene_type:complete
MANPSLSEYLSQSQRGLYQSVFGPEFMQKQTYFTVDTATGIFNTTYGKKVWQALNNQTRFFNAIPRTVWGATAGWRVRTDRGSGRSRPVTETGALPTVDVSDIQTVSSLPRIVSTTFGASVKSVFTAQLEGGVGDVLALESENAQLDHIKEINEELLAGSAYITSAGATTSFTVPAAIAKHFKVGDAVGQRDISAGGFDRTSGSVVSAVNTTTGVVTVASGTTFADGDAAFIYSRAGMTSIDDIVAEDGMAVGGVSGGANVRAYDLTQAGRTAGTWNAAASVQMNSGTGRALSLTLLDTAIQKIRENGGEPKLILLGHDQYFNLERLLNSNQRYLGQEEYQVGVGSERTFPGTRTGLVLATYQGIPILPDADVPKSVASNDAVLGSNIYVLDTDYLEMAVASPTQYIENRDYFAANSLVVRGLLYTMAELRCKNIFVQAKIGDLNA